MRRRSDGTCFQAIFRLDRPFKIIKGSLEDTSELRTVEKRCDWKVK